MPSQNNIGIPPILPTPSPYPFRSSSQQQPLDPQHHLARPTLLPWLALLLAGQIILRTACEVTATMETKCRKAANVGLLNDTHDGENKFMDPEPLLDTTQGTSRTRSTIQSRNQRQHARRKRQPGEEGNAGTPHATTSLNLLPSVGGFRNDGVLVVLVNVCQGLHRSHTVRHIGRCLHCGGPLTHILNLLQVDRILWTWHQKHGTRAVRNSHKRQSTADIRERQCRVQHHIAQTPTLGKGSPCGPSFVAGSAGGNTCANLRHYNPLSIPLD